MPKKISRLICIKSVGLWSDYQVITMGHSSTDTLGDRAQEWDKQKYKLGNALFSQLKKFQKFLFLKAKYLFKNFCAKLKPILAWNVSA